VGIKVLSVVGARPNLIKIAALLRNLAGHPLLESRLLHTGQHYDAALSDVFFKQLEIPPPDIELDVGSGPSGLQTAEIMRRFEPVLESEQPHAVVVVGDVNSTLACAVVAAKFTLARPFSWKFGVRTRPVVAHVEAGLRSFDDDMPEEVNRRLTDAVSDLLFVSDPAGLDNLAREGVAPQKVFFVGNVMIDTLLAAREQAMQSPILDQLGLREREYGLLTLHRPSNVDDPDRLRGMLEILDDLASRLPLVFPAHPRTRQRLDAAGVALDRRRWILTDALGYLDFMRLQSAARVVLTDSGGVQEETTVLGVPCVTLRENTERPVTLSEGTNFLAGTTRGGIERAFADALRAVPNGRVPRYWDGHAAARIVEVLAESFRST
jgi:UDP-N-acetylglucosamine 2-epimerase (non-hydrolysing)